MLGTEKLSRRLYGLRERKTKLKTERRVSPRTKREVKVSGIITEETATDLLAQLNVNLESLILTDNYAANWEAAEINKVVTNPMSGLAKPSSGRTSLTWAGSPRTSPTSPLRTKAHTGIKTSRARGNVSDVDCDKICDPPVWQGTKPTVAGVIKPHIRRYNECVGKEKALPFSQGGKQFTKVELQNMMNEACGISSRRSTGRKSTGRSRR